MHIYTYENCQDLKPEEVFLLYSYANCWRHIQQFSPLFFFFQKFKLSKVPSFFLFFLCFILGGEGWMLREPQGDIEVVFLLVSTVNQDEICSF